MVCRVTGNDKQVENEELQWKSVGSWVKDGNKAYMAIDVAVLCAYHAVCQKVDIVVCSVDK